MSDFTRRNLLKKGVLGGAALSLTHFKSAWKSAIQ